MIKLIGKKRALLLGVILGINLAAGAGWILLAEPMRGDAENQLNNANGQISSVSTKIQSIKAELSAYPGNYARYQELGVRGFFGAQDRFEAGRLLDALRERSGLINYTYRIDALRDLNAPLAEAADSRLIDSKITLSSVASVTDANVFTLMRNLSSAFPQHVRVSRFEMRRDRDVNEAALRDIAQGSQGGKSAALTTASLTFDWLTVVPKTDAPADLPGAQDGGFRGR